MFDLCIVGAGLVGSAAARHASYLKDARVCIIGPKEPEDLKISTGREIFGAHYDEGRITRMTAADPVWSKLAQESIKRYRDLEKSQFYEEVGCLMAGNKYGEFIDDVNSTVANQKIDVQHLDNEDLVEKFHYFNLSTDDIAVYEDKNAGHISPRKLIEAQLTVAARNGCHVCRDVVCEVKRVTGASGRYHMELKTEKGQTISAHKVLLTTGAFTSVNNHLGTEVIPDMRLCPLTVAKVQISDQDATRLIQEGVPSALYYGYGAKDWWKEFPKTKDDMYALYFLPPVKYPDGKYYLKLGHFHDCVLDHLDTLSDMQKWFCQRKNTELAENTAKVLMSLVTGIKMLSFHGCYCAIQETPNGRPYIDKLHSQLGVSIGGNGYAAKSSDEIGRISAMMMLMKQWHSDIPKDAFKLILKPPRHVHSKL